MRSDRPAHAAVALHAAQKIFADQNAVAMRISVDLALAGLTLQTGDVAAGRGSGNSPGQAQGQAPATEKARAMAQAVLDQAIEQNGSTLMASAYLLLGRCELEADGAGHDQTALAEESARQALALATASGAPELTMQAHLLLAQSAAEAGQVESAWASYLAAISVAEQMRVELHNDEFQLGFGAGAECRLRWSGAPLVFVQHHSRCDNQTTESRSIYCSTH